MPSGATRSEGLPKKGEAPQAGALLFPPPGVLVNALRARAGRLRRPRASRMIRVVARRVCSGRPEGKTAAPLFYNGGSMGIIAFIILGLLAGAIAKAIMPGDDPGGFIVTAIIGIVGALLGGFIAAALFDAHPLDEFFDISTWVTAILGAIALLVIYRLVVDRGGHGRTLRA